MNWSFPKSIAQSKIVRTSFIWLIIAPLAAKAFEKLPNPITYNIQNQKIKIITELPFSWEFLFYAATSFTIANIIYQVFCPEIFKNNHTYKTYSENGNSILATHYAVKKMIYDLKNSRLKKGNQRGEGKNYLEKYILNLKSADDTFSESVFDTREGVNNFETKSEAFYMAMRVANLHNRAASTISSILYGIGLTFVTIIFLENIYYVITKSSLFCWAGT